MKTRTWIAVTLLAAMIGASGSYLAMRSMEPAKATLRLISLECRTPQEPGDSPDEPYLLVGGRKVWEEDTGKNEIKRLHGLAAFPFVDTIRVVLMEGDPSGNPDERLGELLVQADDGDSEEVTVELTGEGAVYLLTYQVVADVKP